MCHTVDRGRVYISIHALLAESDTPITFRHCTTYLFLSTLSLRRATGGGHISETRSKHFYPRSPCGERPSHRSNDRGPVNFYPRSPCGERPIAGRIMSKGTKFLSTLSLRRATNSTNANLTRHSDFYPRSPCGERRRWSALKSRRIVFLSTLSLRRATNQSPSGTTSTAYFYPRSPCGERPRQNQNL